MTKLPGAQISIEEAKQLVESAWKISEQLGDTTNPIAIFANDKEPRSYRTLFEYKGMLVIVKWFPGAPEADKYSVKFFTEPELVFGIVSFWRTNDPFLDDSERKVVLEETMNYFFRVVRRVRT